MSKNFNLLLELGCEEIPARFMPGFLSDLKAKAEEKLRRERLAFGQVMTLGTNRRLVLYVEALADSQADLAEEVKGPPADIAFDQAGNPKPAATGFAKSQGIDLKDIVIKPVGNKNYLFAKVEKKGEKTAKLLPALLPEILTSLYQPLAMRWGGLDFKFIRPIHWIVALYGPKVVKFELAGIKTGAKTAGHRFIKATAAGLTIKTADLNGYKAQLAKLGVTVDQNERQLKIKKEVEQAAAASKLKVLIDEALLSEVNFLVENPIAYVGSFDPKFLEVPQDVLITSMKKNQKYFPLLDNTEKLAAKFIVVTNGCHNQGVVEGNQKVLTARLSDARFFFEEDKKLPLKLRVTDLAGVAFFEKLGSIADKTERLEKLAEHLGHHLGLKPEAIARVKKISQLCKADLTTKMVYEFPELQGTMGKEYALIDGEDKVVAQGIFEHYLPRFADDLLPATMEGAAVALADRLDSLVGYFSVGAIPTGSEDPYGLRRAALGIIRILLENKLSLALDEAIGQSYKLYEKIFQEYLFSQGEIGYQDFPKIKKQVLEFIFSRLRPTLIDQGIRYDIADAVLADCTDMSSCSAIAKAVMKAAAEPWFLDIVRSADRIGRIAKDSKRDTVIAEDLVEKEEKELHDLHLKINWETAEAVQGGKWGTALLALAKLTPAVDLFFDKILVMHQDERIKSNRLALLKSLANTYRLIADFGKIVVDGDKK